MRNRCEKFYCHLGIFRDKQQVTGEENQLSLEKNWS